MDERTFLRLLLDEAPAAAIEDELRQARQRGLDGAELERLAEAGYLAMQLRLVLRERRRREAELAALFATAGDLIAIRSGSCRPSPGEPGSCSRRTPPTSP